MREIICSGKRIKDGKWIEGFYVKFYSNGEAEENHMIFTINEEEKSSQPYSVDPKTICQYTGMTDKNGRKIFEEDIVRRTDLHNTKEPSVGFVEYDAENTAFLIHWTDVQNYSATFPWKDKIEVIGNIFDNPELLQ
ncbi:MAG: hypothetical protein HDR24_13150 [Lachnospiraceae bacterium]|nr:hypothetical protein [Lachnospiraceae bacterium]